MADMRQAFPGKYFKEADLGGQPLRLVIASMGRDNVAGEGQVPEVKPIVYFEGKEQGLALNITNNETIMSFLGYDSDGWIGKTIELYPTTTQFGKKTVPCIRVRSIEPMGGSLADQAVRTVKDAFPGAEQVEPAHVDPDPPPWDV